LEKGGKVKAGDYISFCGKGNKNHDSGTGLTLEFVSDRVSYSVLRGCGCNIIVLKMNVPSEEKSDDSKDNFCEELEQDFVHFPVPNENSVRAF
jgi:hypothetical protein